MTSAAAAVIYIAGSPAVNPQIRIPIILTAVAMPQTASIFFVLPCSCKIITTRAIKKTISRM